MHWDSLTRPASRDIRHLPTVDGPRRDVEFTAALCAFCDGAPIGQFSLRAVEHRTYSHHAEHIHEIIIDSRLQRFVVLVRAGGGVTDVVCAECGCSRVTARAG